MAEKTALKTVEVPSEKSEREKRIAAGQCVVDDSVHVGHAVNGLVCSYHAMHYDAEGNRRI